MKISQRHYKDGQWNDIRSGADPNNVQLILCFGSKDLVKQQERFDEIRNMFPRGYIVLCSTSGEIMGQTVSDNTLSATAIEFDSSRAEAHMARLAEFGSSESVGRHLGEQLAKENLKHVLLFTDGLAFNGDEIIRSLQAALPDNVAITGGSAGDAAEFKETYIGLDNLPMQDSAVVIGLYGDSLSISYGSEGGWDPFGITRKVTKSIGNVVYSLDNIPILDIYKEYIGTHSVNNLDDNVHLAAAGLMFPLSVREKDTDTPIVRSIMSVNEDEKSVVYAGNVPEGSFAQLMKASVNRLVDGAEVASKISSSMHPDQQAQLAILVSCIGRKLVLKQRTEEELESVQQVLGDDCAMTGYYSYGEFTPYSISNNTCRLQNQTMTITTLAEQTNE